MNNDNSLTHYGVKGMQWGKRKKSYYDGSNSPFSEFNRTTQKVYYDKDGTAQVVKDNVPSRPKTSQTGYHNHGGNKPLQKGKGLYKKGSGLGTGPVSGGKTAGGAKVVAKAGGKKSVPKGAMTRSNNGSSNKPMGINEWGYGPYHSYTVVGSSAVGPQVGDRKIRKREKATANNNKKNLTAVLRQKFNVKNRPIKNAVNKGKAIINAKLSSLKPKNNNLLGKAGDKVSSAYSKTPKSKIGSAFNGSIIKNASSKAKTAKNKAVIGNVKSNIQAKKNFNAIKSKVTNSYSKAHAKQSYNTVKSYLKNPRVYKIKKRLGFG